MNNRHRRIKRISKEKMIKTLFIRRGATACHKTGQYKCLGELVDVHSQNKKYYFGNFSQPYGMLMINMKFKKKDCVQLSPEETKKVFLRLHDENTYKWWFGKNAV